MAQSTSHTRPSFKAAARAGLVGAWSDHRYSGAVTADPDSEHFSTEGTTGWTTRGGRFSSGPVPTIEHVAATAGLRGRWVDISGSFYGGGIVAVTDTQFICEGATASENAQWRTSAYALENVVRFGETIVTA